MTKIEEGMLRYLGHFKRIYRVKFTNWVWMGVLVDVDPGDLMTESENESVRIFIYKVFYSQ